MGITVIGYIFQLPYIEGVTRIESINYVNAVLLASEVGATIEFDEVSQASFFYFGESKEYFVWFKDARSLDNIIKLVPEYGCHGIAIWNIMYYLAQLMLVTNSQYEIEKVL